MARAGAQNPRDERPCVRERRGIYPRLFGLLIQHRDRRASGSICRAVATEVPRVAGQGSSDPGSEGELARVERLYELGNLRGGMRHRQLVQCAACVLDPLFSPAVVFVPFPFLISLEDIKNVFPVPSLVLFVVSKRFCRQWFLDWILLKPSRAPPCACVFNGCSDLFANCIVSLALLCSPCDSTFGFSR